MSKKFSYRAIISLMTGGDTKEIQDYLQMTKEEAISYLDKRFGWIKDSPKVKDMITIVPPKRPKNKDYTNKTVRGRYRYHKEKAVESEPTPPDLAKREANKRKAKAN